MHHLTPMGVDDIRLVLNANADARNFTKKVAMVFQR
jgi:hypothetical protein